MTLALPPPELRAQASSPDSGEDPVPPGCKPSPPGWTARAGQETVPRVSAPRRRAALALFPGAGIYNGVGKAFGHPRPRP